MIIVKIEGKMSIDGALKKLKNKFIGMKTLKELNERKAYKKPSAERREEIKAAQHRERMRKKSS